MAKATFCSLTGLCKPKLAGGGNCAGEGDRACRSANCAAGACSACPKGMVHVAASTVVLGADVATPNSSADERPLHSVTVSAFCVDRTEVTVADYRECVTAGACTSAGDSMADANCTFTANAGANDARPVNCITWAQAKTFCEWGGNGTVHALGARRLPTEAEWEKQCRAGDMRTFPWGEAAPTCQHANHDPGDTNGNTSCTGGNPRTTIVGGPSKGEGPYGTLDAAGNVWEWIADWYGASYYASACESGCTDPKGPANGTVRGRRGGAWTSGPTLLRCAFRNYSDPTASRNNTGVRCVSASF